ncbi:hypothetical protein CPAR01_13968 [Colletotrichum paranaense]|uniref:Uncharacterized protein n=1 Tax=Colletotrichum paranaense TaxID=1914294 RepID=A0ABQ9S2S7_9PEZI|nr:uncharacterized protein CPAR01_13968 [Colletotrichum paranaense]KAK1523115.1 hypothetical protein CPAR01_13968 [Colletotrichum paranaense]
MDSASSTEDNDSSDINVDYTMALLREEPQIYHSLLAPKWLDMRWTINVNNLSANATSFILYPSPPKFISNDPGDSNVFTCVYQQSKSINARTGSTVFGIAMQGVGTHPVVVVTGSPNHQLEPNLEVYATDTCNAYLAEKPKASCTMTLTKDAAPYFTTSSSGVYENSKSRDASIRISCGSFPGDTLARPFVGLGAPAPVGVGIVPIVVWKAVPSQSFNLAPMSNKWRITKSTSKPRTILDLSSQEPSDWIEVEFTDDNREIQIDHNNDGTFSLSGDE